MKLSPHLPETLPSSSKRLVSWPEFRVANPSLAGFQVSLQALALLYTRIASGHIYSRWLGPFLPGQGWQQAATSNAKKEEAGQTGHAAASEAQDADGLNIRDPGLIIPKGQVLQLPSVASLRALPARPVKGLWGHHPLPQHWAEDPARRATAIPATGAVASCRRTGKT